jgi:hypothetical protein
MNECLLPRNRNLKLIESFPKARTPAFTPTPSLRKTPSIYRVSMLLTSGPNPLIKLPFGPTCNVFLILSDLLLK